MLGVVLALVAAAGFGAASFLARLGLRSIGTATGTFISLIASLLVALAASLIFQFHYVVTLTLSAVFWFGLVGVAHFGLGRFLNYEGLRNIGAARATVLFCTFPLFAMVMSVLFIGETLNSFIVTGTLLIIGGASLVVMDAQR